MHDPSMPPDLVHHWEREEREQKAPPHIYFLSNVPDKKGYCLDIDHTSSWFVHVGMYIKTDVY